MICKILKRIINYAYFYYNDVSITIIGNGMSRENTIYCRYIIKFMQNVAIAP